MLKLIAEDFINPVNIETVIPLYRELVAKTKAEPQCLAYDLYHDFRHPGHFIFVEEWPNDAALKCHTESEHFKRLIPLIDQYTIKEARYTHMLPFETALH